MSHHFVAARNLRHVYPDGTVALADVSFRITHGESVAVIGANGAGKSTLLLHLNGYLAPTSGEIRIGDLPLTRSTLPELLRPGASAKQQAAPCHQLDRATRCGHCSGAHRCPPQVRKWAQS